MRGVTQDIGFVRLPSFDPNTLNTVNTLTAGTTLSNVQVSIKLGLIRPSLSDQYCVLEQNIYPDSLKYIYCELGKV